MSSIFAGAHTRVLNEVIREIETDPTTYLGAKYLPAREIAATTVFLDVWEARGGLMQEHTLGADAQFSARRQFRTQQYSPGYYKEAIRFGEADILHLRQLGQNDQSGRGIQEHLNENGLALNHRMEARMELLRWQAIFNGTFTYDNKVVSFGVPAANNVAPTAVWGFNDGAGNYTTANPAANPVFDFRTWVDGGYATFRKYVITSAIMNPNTARMFLNNPNVQSLIQYRMASDSMTGNYDINKALSFLVPGAPPVTIYKGWYQPETINATTGQITVGTAQYFIPDGSIYFETDLPDNNKIGDFVMTLNLSNGDINNPTPGKFIVVDEKIKDHAANPHINLVGGFYGGPRLKRGFDVLTATCI